MTSKSRARFRPPWMGKFNAMRDRYAAGEIAKAEIDAWFNEIARVGERAFEHVTCSKPHATTARPLPADHANDEDYQAAHVEWLRLGSEAARCVICSSGLRNYLHGENH